MSRALAIQLLDRSPVTTYRRPELLDEATRQLHAAGCHARDAHTVLDILADHSRKALLAGQHLLCLLQVDDPDFTVPPVGAVAAECNDKQWRAADRGTKPWWPAEPRSGETDTRYPIPVTPLTTRS